MCRKRVKEVSEYSVNVVLEEMLLSRYGSHKVVFGRYRNTGSE